MNLVIDTDVAHERVCAGAEALDQAMPGWYDIINLDVFDVAVACRCTAGQLGEHHGVSYTEIVESVMTVARVGWQDEPGAEILLGFEVERDRYQFDVLTAFWRAEILARRQR